MPIVLPSSWGSRAWFLQAIRYKLSDTISSNYNFQDSELYFHLQDAVLDYSRYRPYQKQAVLSVTANTQLYALPTDLVALNPEDFVYRVTPSLNPDIQTLIVSDLFTAFAHTGDYVVNDIRFDVWQRFNEYGEGVWRIYGNQISLFPTPTYNDTINYWYGAIHPADSTTGEYTTIPYADIPIVLDFLEANCLEILANDMMKNPEYREGQTTVKYDPTKLFSRAGSIRARYQDQLTSHISARA